VELHNVMKLTGLHNPFCLSEVISQTAQTITSMQQLLQDSPLHEDGLLEVTRTAQNASCSRHLSSHPSAKYLRAPQCCCCFWPLWKPSKVAPAPAAQNLAPTTPCSLIAFYPFCPLQKQVLRCPP